MTNLEKKQAWLSCPAMPEELLADLKGMDEAAANDAFYRELAFGTGGLRGVLGAGTNRMNLFTVRKATRGLGAYLKETFAEPSCAISCDSRIHSRDFAELTAAVLAEMGVRVYLYPRLQPTPMLSYAVRHLHTSAGVISYITEETIEAYYQDIWKLRVHPCDQPLHLVYSPLNGTGNIPVREIMRRLGNIRVDVVEEQELMGAVDAYKPGVGQASVVATRLEEQRQAQREMEQAAE